MTGIGEIGGGRPIERWKLALWAVGGLVLLVPLVAMQFTDEVDWGVFDFVVVGAMIFGTLGLFEIAARMSEKVRYRAGAGLALFAGLFLVWSNLAVGLIGSEDNPANLMFLGVLAIGGVGAWIARLEAQGMAWACLAMACAQAAIGFIAVFAGFGLPENGPVQLLEITAFFAGLWLASAWLFRSAARERMKADPGP